MGVVGVSVSQLKYSPTYGLHYGTMLIPFSRWLECWYFRTLPLRHKKFRNNVLSITGDGASKHLEQDKSFITDWVSLLSFSIQPFDLSERSKRSFESCVLRFCISWFGICPFPYFCDKLLLEVNRSSFSYKLARSRECKYKTMLS